MFKLIKLDMRLTRRDLAVSACFVALSAFVLLFVGYCKAATNQVDINELSFADNAMIVLAGCAPFEFRPGIVFVPPLGWLLLLVSVFYGSAAYPSRSLRGFGRSLMIEAGSRKKWLIAKMVFVLYANLTLCAVMVLVTMLWTMVLGQEVSLVAHRGLLCLLGIADSGFSRSGISIVTFVGGAAVALVALTVVQFFVGIALGLPVAFALSILQLVIASYYKSAFLVANLLMGSRWEGMTADSVPFFTGIAFAVAAIALFGAFSLAFISHVDIIERRSDHAC